MSAERNEVLWYLKRIDERIRRVDAFMQGKSVEQLRSEPILQDAVIRNLQMIGESARRLVIAHPNLVSAHPEFRLMSLRGMRNCLSHEYHEPSPGMLHRTATVTLREVGQAIRFFIGRMSKAAAPTAPGFSAAYMTGPGG